MVESRDGDIFDKDYLEVVRQVNDRIYLQPGIDRAWMKSVWTPATRWTEITEEGYRGGPVMPFDYNGSPESVTQFRVNVLRAGLIGKLVGSDYKSSMIVVPLLERIPETGEPIDYSDLSEFLEKDIRSLQTRAVPDPHHRLREARRRHDRRHPHGAGLHGVLRPDRDADHLCLHARCAQHAAAGRARPCWA